MNFGQALEALKNGKRASRAGWNGKGMWIALTPGSTFPAGSAKVGHAAWHRACEFFDDDAPAGRPLTPITLLPHIDMRAADGSMVIGWLASQTDMLAEDWEVLE